MAPKVFPVRNQSRSHKGRRSTHMEFPSSEVVRKGLGSKGNLSRGVDSRRDLLTHDTHVMYLAMSCIGEGLNPGKIFLRTCKIPSALFVEPLACSSCNEVPKHRPTRRSSGGAVEELHMAFFNI